MSHPFSPDAHRLSLLATVAGPHRTQQFRLTLDTGSALTVLSRMFLLQRGCDFSRPVGHARLRTATGTVRVPLVRVSAISVLGRMRTDFPVAVLDFPAGVETDGLLGLDFFRGFVLTLDFVRGRMNLSRRRWWHFWL